MLSDELRQVAAALDGSPVAARVLAGGFSHQTTLLTLAGGQVVVRVGGPDHDIETAVMAAARRHVPVPQVLRVLREAVPRSAMVLEYVPGTPLSQVLDEPGGLPLGTLGAEVGRVAAGIGSVTFDRPGFFADDQLNVAPLPPWSQQLPEFGAHCMTTVPGSRLATATRTAWADLCAAHAPALVGVDDETRLVHADLNPKNILVTRTDGGWQVDAILDWEFSFAGCPYADAANMVRFGADYPADFLDGFRGAFAERVPSGVDWLYFGRVMDMFALSDLVTRPVGHPVADRAAMVIRRWVTEGVPESAG
ncbi:MAG TPA: phosphotransferase [Pseudonocardiaceae bacterium]|nr:phosphotransferase [Pseudonocardiaceae bacterium]